MNERSQFTVSAPAVKTSVALLIYFTFAFVYSVICIYIYSYRFVISVCAIILMCFNGAFQNNSLSDQYSLKWKAVLIMPVLRKSAALALPVEPVCHQLRRIPIILVLYVAARIAIWIHAAMYVLNGLLIG